VEVEVGVKARSSYSTFLARCSSALRGPRGAELEVAGEALAGAGGVIKPCCAPPTGVMNSAPVSRKSARLRG
jgi:hypothetical protein